VGCIPDDSDVWTRKPSLRLSTPAVSQRVVDPDETMRDRGIRLTR
jgi:hypothetical protein